MKTTSDLMLIKNIFIEIKKHCLQNKRQAANLADILFDKKVCMFAFTVFCGGLLITFLRNVLYFFIITYIFIVLINPLLIN